MMMNNKPLHIFIFPLVPKTCPICGGVNPLSAKYCGDCGFSFIIEKMKQRDKSPDLLQPKKKDDKSPEKRQNPLTQTFINKILIPENYVTLWSNNRP